MELPDNSYWITTFDVTEADVKRIEEYLDQSKEPKSITELSQRIIRGRIRFGHDISPSALSSWSKHNSTRLWDPAGTWKIGDNVIVVRRPPPSDTFNAYVGEVVAIEKDMVKIRLDTGEVWFKCAEPGSENAIKWHNIVREIVAQKMQSEDIDERVTGIMAQFGDRIVSRISDVLEVSESFIGIRGFWFLSRQVKAQKEDVIRSIYGKLLDCGAALSFEELLTLCPQDSQKGALNELSLLAGLKQFPNHFRCVEGSKNTQWMALPPSGNDIRASYYVYDPETFEIICSPNEILNPKVIQKLKKLNLFAQIVEF